MGFGYFIRGSALPSVGLLIRPSHKTYGRTRSKLVWLPTDRCRESINALAATTVGELIDLADLVDPEPGKSPRMAARTHGWDSGISSVGPRCYPWAC